jgi:hypothetical protein
MPVVPGPVLPRYSSRTASYADAGEGAIRQFIEEGFVRIDQAFPRKLADEGRAILWRDTGCDPDDATTWTRPVVPLGDYNQRPSVKRQILQCLGLLTTTWSARAASLHAEVSEDSRFGFQALMTRVPRGGTSTRAFRASTRSRVIFFHGMSTCALAGVLS